jgi:hypothetical protein
MYHRAQKSLAASDTIRSKLLLEREAADVNVKIKEIHSDNGVFQSKKFRDHCENLNQKLSFSAVGAKHQNAIAENAIRTVCNMARACMIHATIRWPERSLLDMWPQAMSYAIWVHNRLPPHGNGLSPQEVWSGIENPHSELPRAHVFGCPVYVLDPALQDNKKIPKWDSKARQGIFVGFSEEHSSLAPLVYNPRTQHISPQYHVIFDDKFSTVPSLYTEPERNLRWEELFHTIDRELYVDPEDVDAGKIRDTWLLPRAKTQSVPMVDPEDPGLRVHPDASQAAPTVPDREGDAPAQPVPAPPAPVSPATPVPSTPAQPPNPPPPEPPAEDPTPTSPTNTSRYPTRSTRGDWKNGPRKDDVLREHVDKWKTGFITCLLAVMPSWGLPFVHDWGQVPPAVANVGVSNGPVYSSLKVRKNHLAHLSILQEDWTSMGQDVSGGIVQEYAVYIVPDLFDAPGDLTLADIQPHILQAKMKKADPDNPTWTQAMNSPDSDKWWEACEIEMDTLENDLKAWKLVPREEGMNVLPCTWAFKLKRYPDGTVKKFKARLCVRGDCQEEGVDFWETWSPVVQWSTVRTMMMLSTKLGLQSAQADITGAFVHADLEPGEKIYVHQPQGFRRGENLVLSLNKSVYGLRQAPRYFFQHLKERLEKCGLKQSPKDPCLFVGTSVIAVVYVDDILFYSRSQEEISKVVADLRDKHQIAIRLEGDAEGFLGVDIKKLGDGSKLLLTQTGLTKRIVEALGLCSSYSTAIGTPAETSPLPKDVDGEEATKSFNYAAVVGMLLYLSGHSRPDIAFAVHQCARYTFNPTRRHELALIRIGRYLKGIMDKGLILSPTNSPTIDCCPDTDFAGLYGHEDSQDPHCVRSRTGYVILAFGCPHQLLKSIC